MPSSMICPNPNCDKKHRVAPLKKSTMEYVKGTTEKVRFAWWSCGSCNTYILLKDKYA